MADSWSYERQLNLSGAVATAHNYYSSTYLPEKLIDGSTGTYWQTRSLSSAWFKLQLPTAEKVTRFQWYIGNASYRVSSFVLYGSNDDEAYTEIGSGTESTTTTGWKSFDVDNNTPYLYYKWEITAASVSRLYIYEVRLFKSYTVPYTIADGMKIGVSFDRALMESSIAGSLSGFTLSGQEYTYVPGGELQDKTYTLASVEAHPTEPNSILITTAEGSRFCSAAGNLTLSYNGAGGLRGEGDVVAAFTLTITPEDLLPKPHQNDAEHLEITSITPNANLIQIYYSDYQQGGEHLEITSISATATLTHIDDL